MNEAQARVDAIIARERVKSATQRDEMRARYPEASAFISSLREAGMLHAVTVDGRRYGKATLPDRRTGPVPARPPGISLTDLEEVKTKMLTNMVGVSRGRRY